MYWPLFKPLHAGFQKGLKRELGDNLQWHLAFLEEDLTASLRCSQQELRQRLNRQQSPDREVDDGGSKIFRLSRDYSGTKTRQN